MPSALFSLVLFQRPGDSRVLRILQGNDVAHAMIEQKIEHLRGG
jgi:hypothetical protein